MSEITIGKRIQRLRKEKGLTQEQLAQKLGVSPQAVSKWENDYSCPDISVLISLAGALGVTTDVLLGADDLNTETETCENESVKGEFISNVSEKGKRKKTHISFAARGGIWGGVFLLTIGILFVIVSTGDKLSHVSFWDMLWPLALIFIGLEPTCSRRVSVFSVGIMLAGLYFLLNNFGIIPKGDSITYIMIGAILVILGVFAVIRSLIKRNVSFDIDHPCNEHFEYSEEQGYIEYDCSFCEDRRTVVAESLRGGNIEVSFGSFTLDLRDVNAFCEGAELSVDVSFGSLIILLPTSVRIEEVKDQSFGASNTKGSPAPNAPYLLRIKSDVSFASLEMRY